MRQHCQLPSNALALPTPKQCVSIAIAGENEIKGMKVNVEDQDELGSTGGMGKGRWL